MNQKLSSILLRKLERRCRELQTWAESEDKVSETRSWWGVGDLRRSKNMPELNLMKLDLLPNKMTINLNIFGALMEHWVRRTICIRSFFHKFVEMNPQHKPIQPFGVIRNIEEWRANNKNNLQSKEQRATEHKHPFKKSEHAFESVCLTPTARNFYLEVLWISFKNYVLHLELKWHVLYIFSWTRCNVNYEEISLVKKI